MVYTNAEVAVVVPTGTPVRYRYALFMGDDLVGEEFSTRLLFPTACECASVAQRA
jgi:hypothetical protein